jgi:hypothetical protein
MRTNTLKNIAIFTNPLTWVALALVATVSVIAAGALLYAAVYKWMKNEFTDKKAEPVALPEEWPTATVYSQPQPVIIYEFTPVEIPHNLDGYPHPEAEDLTTITVNDTPVEVKQEGAVVVKKKVRKAKKEVATIAAETSTETAVRTTKKWTLNGMKRKSMPELFEHAKQLGVKGVRKTMTRETLQLYIENHK